MDLVIADRDNRAYLVTRDFTLDMQWGDDERGNDFELSGVGGGLQGGDLAYIDGTEFGGVIDSAQVESDSSGVRTLYRGRTWHGVLMGKVVCPPSGESHTTAVGEANSAIAGLLAKCPPGDLFGASVSDSGLSLAEVRLPRFCTLYEALRRICRAAGGRLGISATSAGVRLECLPVVDWGELAEPGGVPFSADSVYRPVNHLVVLGKGEMELREVVHLFADSDGNISEEQSLFGMDERAEVYELSSEEGDGLIEKGAEKLASLQETDTVDIKLGPSASVAVGDRVTAMVAWRGEKVTAEVTGMVIKCSDGKVSATPQTGEPKVIDDRE